MSELDENIYIVNIDKAEKRLKKLLTHEFLSTLTIAVRTVGYSVDNIETQSFAKILFDMADIADKDNVSFKPYKYD